MLPTDEASSSVLLPSRRLLLVVSTGVENKDVGGKKVAVGGREGGEGEGEADKRELIDTGVAIMWRIISVVGPVERGGFLALTCCTGKLP